MMLIKKNNWILFEIFDTDKYVLRKFKNKSEGNWIHPTYKEDWLNWEDESIEKKRGLIKRYTYIFPLSRNVILKNSNNDVVEIIVKSDKNLKLYELLENFHCGYRLNDRERKYINLFIVYEALSADLDIELKAIRHSFAHSRKYLNHKQTVQALLNLFGDVKIDLNRYKHKKIFNEKYKELLIICNNLLVNAILEKAPKKPNFLKRYYII
jgi:hypothetical protein